MRTFTWVVLLFTGLVIAGSIYLHIDTNRFVTDLQQTGPTPEKQTSDSTLPSSDPKTETTTQTTQTEHGTITQTTTETRQVVPWWDDAAHHGHTHEETKDPWGDILSEQSKTLTEEELAELNTDPGKTLEWSREMLIKKHGDIPEVHAYIDGLRKMERRVPLTTEDYLEFLEAVDYFYPHLNARTLIEYLEADIAAGHEVQFVYHEDVPQTPPTPPEEDFSDVEHFFEDVSTATGLRRLRQANPDRAADMEDYFRRKTLENAPDRMEEVEGVIQESYQTPTEGH